MISQRTANLVFAALLLATTAVMAWIAWDFETPALGAATLPTTFFPLVLLGFVALCTLVYAWEYVFLGQSGGDDREQLYESRAHAGRGLLTMLAACTAFVLWREVGFAAAGLFAAPALALAMGTRNLRHLLVVFIGAGITWLAFTFGLGTQFG